MRACLRRRCAAGWRRSLLCLCMTRLAPWASRRSTAPSSFVHVRHRTFSSLVRQQHPVPSSGADHMFLILPSPRQAPLRGGRATDAIPEACARRRSVPSRQAADAGPSGSPRLLIKPHHASHSLRPASADDGSSARGADDSEQVRGRRCREHRTSIKPHPSSATRASCCGGTRRAPDNNTECPLEPRQPASPQQGCERVE